MTDKQEIYQIWKKQKKEIKIPPDFVNQVMDQVMDYEQKKPRPLFHFRQFLSLLSKYPLAQAAMLLTGFALGLTRLILVIFATSSNLMR